MKINILMRHAEKELNKKSFFGNEVGLTCHGITTSKNIGEQYKNRLDIIYTSPIKRCVETANTISQTANCPMLKTNTLLGDPGVLITNTQIAEKYFFSYSPQEIVNHLLSNKPNLPGFCVSTKETIINFLHNLCSISADNTNTTLFITHDIILAAVIGCYFEAVWPDYLESLSFYKKNQNIYLNFRDNEVII